MDKNNSPPKAKTAEDGEECQICPRKDVYRFFIHEVEIVPNSGITAKVKCCENCDKEIKCAKEELAEKKKIEERKNGKTPAEKRADTMRKSHEWAQRMNGKRVEVRWEITYGFLWNAQKEIYKAHGTAYLAGKSACGGWGQIKIILDPEENKRIVLRCHFSNDCPKSGKNMRFMPSDYSCKETDCKENLYVIDGKKYAYVYPNGDGNWYEIVTWSERNRVTPIDEKVET